MKTVAIESPYSGDIERNLEYLDECIRDCLRRGETPYASHKMLTTALDDSDETQRERGIESGLQMSCQLSNRVFYCDLGWSSGMLAAKKRYEIEGLSYEIRFIRDVSALTKNDTPNRVV